MSTIQWLNLLHGSPSFVVRIDPRDGRGIVSQVEVIPNDDGIYWVAGTTVIKRGDSIPSVFEVDTSSGGELVGCIGKLTVRGFHRLTKRRFLALWVRMSVMSFHLIGAILLSWHTIFFMISSCRKLFK